MPTPLDYGRHDAEPKELPRDEKFMRVLLIVAALIGLLFAIAYAGRAIT